MDFWPQYVCAILEAGDGRLLLESRPDDARHAAGRLTCFGGRREPKESPEECLRRELREELNWEPRKIEKRVELWVAGKPIAWFYHATLDARFDLPQIPPQHTALLISPQDLPKHPLSPWHSAVLTAWRAAEPIVNLER